MCVDGGAAGRRMAAGARPICLHECALSTDSSHKSSRLSLLLRFMPFSLLINLTSRYLCFSNVFVIQRLFIAVLFLL